VAVHLSPRLPPPVRWRDAPFSEHPSYRSGIRDAPHARHSSPWMSLIVVDSPTVRRRSSGPSLTSSSSDAHTPDQDKQQHDEESNGNEMRIDSTITTDCIGPVRRLRAPSIVSKGLRTPLSARLLARRTRDGRGGVAAPCDVYEETTEGPPSRHDAAANLQQLAHAELHDKRPTGLSSAGLCSTAPNGKSSSVTSRPPLCPLAHVAPTASS